MCTPNLHMSIYDIRTKKNHYAYTHLMTQENPHNIVEDSLILVCSTSFPK